jgi:NAD(P)-dependent dehydrogenase (short-subunit alcohol dehydrogenase family)
MLPSTVTPNPTSTTTRPPQATGVALVTGGGRGIGRTVARALAGTGVAVALVARSGDELDETVELVRRDGGTAAAARADVTDAAGMAAAVAGLQHRLGPVDLLVNNAGVIGPIGPLWENDPVAWWATMDVNLRGLVLTTQLVLPGMVARHRGRIINVTSQAGAYRWPLVSAYSVSKAAVVKLSENLAHEVRRHGISVFSVHPGLLPIGMTETVAGMAPSTRYEDHVRRWAMTELEEARGAEPAEAVELLMRLAAGDADALSGRHLSVHDDLDALLARAPEVLRDDLYVLRPERLRSSVTPRRSGSRPAYLRGRRIGEWQSALRRPRRPPARRDTL